MSEQWCQRCRDEISIHPAISFLAFVDKNGNLYGNSATNTDFPVTAEFAKAVIHAIQVEAPSSLMFGNEKFITIQRDDTHWMGKCNQKSLFAYICKTICIIGMSIDTSKALLGSKGNSEMAKLCEQYKGSGM
ncbi:unnamed protein product [Calicophoron daubneyi]|uniref:Profilin n=1 Tax=Calicophoron daubneyi TaxID=300641 RepID=A0AAV2TW30_CALDB